MSKKILDLFYDEDSKKYSDNIDFGFSQAEKSLKSSIEISDTIEDKAYKLIGFFITSFIITTGVFFTVLFGTELATHRVSIIMALLMFAVGLWLAIQKTKKTFDIEDYYLLGNLPEKLLKEDCKELSNYQLKLLETSNYSKYIKHNRDKNEQKARLLKESYTMINKIVYTSLALFLGLEALDYFCVLF